MILIHDDKLPLLIQTEKDGTVLVVKPAGWEEEFPPIVLEIQNPDQLIQDSYWESRYKLSHPDFFMKWHVPRDGYITLTRVMESFNRYKFYWNIYGDHKIILPQRNFIEWGSRIKV